MTLKWEDNPGSSEAHASPKVGGQYWIAERDIGRTGPYYEVFYRFKDDGEWRETPLDGPDSAHPGRGQGQGRT